MGSSPHTRDKPEGKRNTSLASRIIPAYAGQTRHSDSLRRQGQDHPRIRGTNKAEVPLLSHPIGSSPHTRDKLHEESIKRKNQGIIPAYAGQTTVWINEKYMTEDHPRIRGTNSFCFLCKFFIVGSSPHTRDKH